jgi:hypothetical protein
MSLEAVLRDAEVEVAVLQKNGHGAQAATLARFVAAVRTAASDYLEWVPEGAAMLRAGRGTDYFRARRETWAEDGLAQQRGRTWWYRLCIIERRKLASITRAEARRSA